MEVHTLQSFSFELQKLSMSVGSIRGLAKGVGRRARPGVSAGYGPLVGKRTTQSVKRVVPKAPGEAPKSVAYLSKRRSVSSW